MARPKITAILFALLFVVGAASHAQTHAPGNYRYGFNGMEKDDEVKGSGNSYDFGLRQYDPRLGRMKSIDPRTTEYPWQSPYVYHRNSPINYIDYKGGGDAPNSIHVDKDGHVIAIIDDGDDWIYEHGDNADGTKPTEAMIKKRQTIYGSPAANGKKISSIQTGRIEKVKEFDGFVPAHYPYTIGNKHALQDAAGRTTMARYPRFEEEWKYRKTWKERFWYQLDKGNYFGRGGAVYCFFSGMEYYGKGTGEFERNGQPPEFVKWIVDKTFMYHFDLIHSSLYGKNIYNQPVDDNYIFNKSIGVLFWSPAPFPTTPGGATKTYIHHQLKRKEGED